MKSSVFLLTLVFWGTSVFAAEGFVLPRRLVLALDGIAHSDVARMQSQGHFSRFFPVSRNISTFPSISDPAWADIFQTQPPDGYQRFHFSFSANRILGGALSDLGNALEYEKRMNIAFEAKLHHVRSYLSARKSARYEIDEIVSRFLNERREGDYYAYMLSTDTLQHTDGDVNALLRQLDRKITALEETYEKLTGRRLEVVILSDHGNNHENRGKRVPLRERLVEAGYRFVESLKDERDVSFTCAGILGALAVYAAESRIDDLADKIIAIEGVDLVTTVTKAELRGHSYYDYPDAVLIRGTDGSRALVRRKPGTVDVYSYVPLQGDPLDYAGVLGRLGAEGKIDSEGYAAARDWLAATSAHFYPAAPERIYRGHHAITFNPARLLVSLKDGYENANSVVKFMTHFKKRGGTHGALSAKSSNGIVMTNFRETTDTTTNQVAAQLGFGLEKPWKSMRDYRREQGGGQFIDGREFKNETEGEPDYLESSGNEVFLNFWDPRAIEFDGDGVTTLYRFVIKRDGFFLFNRKVADGKLPSLWLGASPDQSEFRIPLRAMIGDRRLKGGDYLLRIYAQRVNRTSGRFIGKSRLLTRRFFVGKDGALAGY